MPGAPRPTRRSWLRFGYDATFSLDPGGPTWATAVLKEVRLPRWSFELVDKGAAVFVRTVEETSIGPAETRLWLVPERPMPQVRLQVAVQGRWTDDDEVRRPPPGFAHLLEEAEALLVLLGCRNPRFRWRETVRTSK